MVGTKHSGNPNIGEISKRCSTGPKTEIGKMKVSMNALKNKETAVRIGESQIRKLMEDAGVDFSKAEKAIEKLNLFKMFIDSKSAEELDEIKRLEVVIKILNTDLAMRVMNKLEEGYPLDNEDIKLIRLLKETLEASHKIKHGEKKVSIHADFQDIREMMMNDS